METEKLYYQDPYLTAFTARVLSCEKSKSGWAVVLDRTAFYPEGGGQPADHGTLGAVQVTDVHETKGVIFHTCDGPVEIGTQVAGAVDWPRRFDHMQQHSGEHILSGLLCSLYHCDNVGFHLGADTVTIDYNAELTWEQVMAGHSGGHHLPRAGCAGPSELPQQESAYRPGADRGLPRGGLLRLLRHPRAPGR